MAEFKVSDSSIHHISVPGAELDVVNGVVDFSDVDEDERAQVEADVRLALDRFEGAAVSEEASDEADAADQDSVNDNFHFSADEAGEDD